MKPPNIKSVGIIGAGRIGQAMARIASRAGRPVVIANKEGPQSLASLVQQLGDGVSAGTVNEAAGADIVVLAVMSPDVRQGPRPPVRRRNEHLSRLGRHRHARRRRARSRGRDARQPPPPRHDVEPARHAPDPQQADRPRPAGPGRQLTDVLSCPGIRPLTRLPFPGPTLMRSDGGGSSHTEPGDPAGLLLILKPTGRGWAVCLTDARTLDSPPRDATG
jgi:F420-dependent NADP oxidoreductase-like protein